MLEIEKRGFLTKEKYREILDFLKKNGESLGEDDKDAVYYIYADKLLKIVNNVSKKNAKVSLKTGKIGEDSVFPETEIFFESGDFEKMRYVFDNIAKPDKVMSGIQKRSNFIYKNCEIAIKWSKEWEFHFEIEKMVETQSEVLSAEKEIENVAAELGLEILTEEVLSQWTKKIEETNNTNYRDSLLGKIKPLHQSNDMEAVNWIKRHRPFNINRKYDAKTISAITRILEIKPWNFFQENFYLEQKVLDGIHGAKHAQRVAINALCLVLINDMQEINLENLLICALFHDSARINDNTDEEHGKRSAERFKTHCEQFNITDWEPFYFAILYHDTEYVYFEKSEDYQKYKKICDLIKVADALDRYRFPIDKWWIKEKFIRFPVTEEQKRLSFDLCVSTEESYLKSGKVDYEAEIREISGL